MRQCSKNQKRFFADASGAANDAETREHLASCGSCRRAYSEAQRIEALLKGMPPPALPHSFDGGLRKKLAVAQARREQTGPIAKIAAALAIVSPSPYRRAVATLGFGASLAAVAAGILFMPRLGPGAGALDRGGNKPFTSATVTISPLPASLPKSDAAFIAACSSQDAQYAATQSVDDPAASTLAASLDETRTAAPAAAGDSAQLQTD